MENRISISFPSELLEQIDAAIANLEGLLADKLISLTAEENQMYGKLGNETENFTKMMHADITVAENMIPAFIDRTEWDRDVAVRAALSPRITRLQGIVQRMDETNRLAGFDIYQTCLAVYNNTKLLSNQNVGAAKTYYEKWKVQFPHNSKRPKPAMQQ